MRYSAPKLNKQSDNIPPSFLNFEPVCCSMFSSNCCFLTHIQVSQETGNTVWYSNLFKNFPQFFVIHTVNGFCVVNEDAFLKPHCFLHDPTNVDNLISSSSASLKPTLYIQNFSVQVLLKPSFKHFNHPLHRSQSWPCVAASLLDANYYNNNDKHVQNKAYCNKLSTIFPLSHISLTIILVSPFYITYFSLWIHLHVDN